ncbi:MAG TPA: LysR family transcriptional regulator [Polynucleobacter sp.]|jgi:DNA-binding transcriptional LysR family regulator|nr:MAG: LysR family transcriptional regulator [Polynucleobacter sp. 16-46-70]HQR84046.1 LysR family transcriptional regulator [Polynucleobacter sp.]HQS60467.1 LysR family transcriptional regulator [Polynucleobacter sp.]HQT20301.1 LysR family transcriptional regulator [Polynucleobacter sp.]HQT41226.1 LysR family transcriptional regulator [Polynucleobacter sp.]
MRPYTLKQIHTFIEVAKENSISKAADNLFVTQPAISMQIKQLEDVFGIPLIEPLGRNIQLTSAGKAFLDQALTVMSELKDLEAIMAGHRNLGGGVIYLGIVSTTKYFVPMLLVEFHKLFPGIEVILKIDNRENILAMLARNEVDLVIMGRVPKEMACVAVPFVTNPMAIVSSPSHPFSRRKQLKFSDLADQEFVVREMGSGTRQAMERLFQENQTPLKIAMEMPSNETIKQAVMAGMGLSFLSLRTVRHEMGTGHIALLDVIGLPHVGHWYITHRIQKKLSPAAIALKEFVIEQGGPRITVWA